MEYLTSLLSFSHKKEGFDSGNTSLDTFLHTRAKQEVKSKRSACFVLASEEQKIVGFYTLERSEIEHLLLSKELKRAYPKFARPGKNLPVLLLKYLGVDKAATGKRLGEQLLVDALKRSADKAPAFGSMAIVADPGKEQGERFYLKYGFRKLPESGKMFLPMKKVRELFG